MTYGYVRVSTVEQNLERQLEEIRKYVEDDRYIIQDKASGKDFKRPGYNTLVGTEDTVPLLREAERRNNRYTSDKRAEFKTNDILQTRREI